ncbi:MAG TPA: Gfo/Idh/MocA family oxidoreductase [Segeticoccus sp.]|uniref:Gfo/Idh/MocA family protein n=1 Tax=Segeticoccus sp. TaxID=2706531 RepID=UPI002D8026CB|nr:Gfo/Idh/MocA family oxidoreductase [Segeticoccus sp.]HET8601280.1 Gfo/Idh/MocA family oxidoreductase [Segeticoccus sp.]
MSRPLRVGLAGYGLGGRRFHLPPMLEAGLDVVAVATRDPERSAHVRADLPDAVVVPDLEALLEQDADLVVLATHSGAHTRQALQVIDAGRPVVVDKPLGVNARQTREVVEAAAAKGVPLSVFQNRRYDPAHATLRSLVDAGRLGDVYRHEFRWERWRPEPRHRWREEAPATQGGGILLDLGTHLVDAAVDLFGPIRSVYAEVVARTTPADDDDFLACRHESGVVSHLGTMSASAAPGPRLRVLGSAAAYLLGEFEEDVLTFPELANASPRHSGWLYRGAEREPVPAVPAAHADYYRGVARALATEDPQAAMPVDPRDAVHVMEVLDAARASAERGSVEYL